MLKLVVELKGDEVKPSNMNVTQLCVTPDVRLHPHKAV